MILCLAAGCNNLKPESYRQPNRLVRGVFLLTAVLWLLSGCAPPPRDPYSADEHRRRADANIIAGDLPAAANELAMAIRKSPTDPELYLRRGELLEAVGNTQEAQATYDEALANINENLPQRQEIIYRLSLLEVLRLGRPERSRELLKRLPEGSAPHLDLQGVLALSDGKSRQALILFNQALEKGPDRQTAARTLYHAALAYEQIGDMGNALSTLYSAINLAENKGLLTEIESLFNRINPQGR